MTTTASNDSNAFLENACAAYVFSSRKSVLWWHRGASDKEPVVWGGGVPTAVLNSPDRSRLGQGPSMFAKLGGPRGRSRVREAGQQRPQEAGMCGARPWTLQSPGRCK